MSSTLIFVLFAGYMTGAIPFGLLWAKLFGLGNLRDIGSGNIGATNVLRTGNKKAAILTLICDMAKGAGPVLVIGAIFGFYAGLIAGLGAFLGHLYPIWLKFQGGKGVATFLGVMLAVNFWAGLAICGTWIATAAIGRISSLAALVAAISAPIWFWVFDGPEPIKLAITLGAMIFMRHAENIRRLMAGDEPRIGTK